MGKASLLFPLYCPLFRYPIVPTSIVPTTSSHSLHDPCIYLSYQFQCTKMIPTTYYNVKAHQPSGSPDTSPPSPSAECQRMPATIRRQLRAIRSSPRWRLVALISTMLFVVSSASYGSYGIKVKNSGLADGKYFWNGQRFEGQNNDHYIVWDGQWELRYTPDKNRLI